MTALGAMRAISARGLRIPADISIVGFDDLFFAQYCVPPLTTVRQPMRDMGRLALDTLMKLLAEDGSQPNIKVPGELIVRHSTAPPQENA